MPGENQTPIAPEDKHAASRVRSIFFMIAAANIVLVAIVLWQRQAHKDHEGPPAKPATSEDATANRTRTEANRNSNAPGK